MKKRKGERVRPCARCEQPIMFIKGTWTAHGAQRQGWHWTNDDGSHHRCSEFQSNSTGFGFWDEEWRKAIERDNPLNGAGTGHGLERVNG